MTTLSTVAAMVRALPCPGPALLVGIDGVDGAGKTTFADALAALLPAAIRAGADDFLRPRAERYRLGRDSPEGFFADTYDYPALRSKLLDPLRTGGPYQVKAFDHRRDEPVDAPAQVAPPGAVLVLDGMFLHRPELRGYWDLSVFLRVDFAVTFARMAVRDGSPADPAAAANRRYLEGQRRYLTRCTPEAYASIVVDNTDPAAPVIVRSPGVSSRTSAARSVQPGKATPG